MAEPFLAEIRLVSFDFPPKGWAFCRGQLLPINQNQNLFALLGTTYGGDGRVNFALPDLRDRIPIHMSDTHYQGERSGSPAVTLGQAEVPDHTHAAMGAAGSIGTTNEPLGNAHSVAPMALGNVYGTSYNAALPLPGLQNVGGSQPHTNLMPTIALNYVIALIGIFPEHQD